MLALVAVGAAALAFVSTFLPYYAHLSVTATVMNQTLHQNVPGTFTAWYGVLGWLGGVLILVGGALLCCLVAQVIPATRTAIAHLGALCGLAVGWVLILLSGFIDPNLNPLLDAATAKLGVSWAMIRELARVSIGIGRGVGFWLALAFGLVALGLALWTFPTIRHMAPAAAAPAAAPSGWEPVPLPDDTTPDAAPDTPLDTPPNAAPSNPPDVPSGWEPITPDAPNTGDAHL
jgi:hypothetical protein